MQIMRFFCHDVPRARLRHWRGLDECSRIFLPASFTDYSLIINQKNATLSLRRAYENGRLREPRRPFLFSSTSGRPREAIVIQPGSFTLCLATGIMDLTFRMRSKSM